MKHHYTKLLNEIANLNEQAISLIQDRLHHEGIMKTALANAWKQFGCIAEMTDMEEARTRATYMRLAIEDAMKKLSGDTNLNGARDERL